MSRKRVLLVIVGLVVFGGVALMLTTLPKSQKQGEPIPVAASSPSDSSKISLARPASFEQATALTQKSESLSKPPPAQTQSVVKTTAAALSAPDPDPSGLPPETVLENVRSAFRNYAARFGGNPVGTNPEITAALNGGNSGQVQFVNTDDGLRVNEDGELIDSWGTPYFFHQLSGTEMEIHSAGPDRRMWTADDLVIK